MKILVIANTYPSLQKPNFGAFVYNLMQELTREHKITVITPFKINDIFKPKQISYGNEMCKVKRPNFISFGNTKVGFIDTGKITHYFYTKAIQRTLSSLKLKPDIIYTHFLSNAIPVLDYAKKHNIPIVVASGESTYTSFENKGLKIKNRLIEDIAHIIGVSIENKEQLTKLGFDPNKISVIPNAVNYDLFKPMDKNVCKEKLGLPSNIFVVGFIGHFIHRKGPNRIIEAIKRLNDENIQLVCVGGDKEQLIVNNFTKVMTPIPNYQLPEVLNAFDIFVLPTLNEGHCNVIEEAKACAIPIISSRGTSVEEQIDEFIGVLVDPLNIDEIANAILALKKNIVLRDSMSNTLLKRRGENSIEKRSKKINKIFQLISKLK